MKRAVALTAAAGALFAACYKVPYTNRKALNPVPDALMVSLSKGAYADMLSGVKVKKKGEDAELLDKIGKKIARVAKKPEYDWEVALIDEDTVNAWCMPGGKIGFYTGILPVLENEAGVAFVMGHEVGHAIARHGGERMGQQIALFGGLAGLYAVLNSETKMTREQSAMLTAVVGAGAQVGVILPFSRMHESEADVIGTMYMASAGYPPQEGIKVWDRMGAGGGLEIPAFLSTHPSDNKRQDVIREWLPKAKKRYERNKITGRDTQKTLWEGGPGDGKKGKKKKDKDGGKKKDDGPVSAPR